MAVGKQKLKAKKIKKKTVDTFAKKEWYNIKAPNMFSTRTCGKTIVNRTQGLKLAADGLRGRVFELNLADLNKDPQRGYRKIKLVCEEVNGNDVLTDFYGMDMTRDKLMSLFKKWQTTIEAAIDTRTTDGVNLRVFVIAFTRKQAKQVTKTSYAQASQIRKIRKKMTKLVQKEVAKSDLKDIVKKFNTEIIAEQITKQCEGIYPLQNCFIRKVKVLKKPKFDVSKLLELHTETAEDTGAKVTRPETEKFSVKPLVGSGGRL
jgi:small subunit ribosomal protein S3Ae